MSASVAPSTIARNPLSGSSANQPPISEDGGVSGVAAASLQPVAVDIDLEDRSNSDPNNQSIAPLVPDQATTPTPVAQQTPEKATLRVSLTFWLPRLTQLPEKPAAALSRLLSERAALGCVRLRLLFIPALGAPARARGAAGHQSRPSRVDRSNCQCRDFQSVANRVLSVPRIELAGETCTDHAAAGLLLECFGEAKTTGLVGNRS